MVRCMSREHYALYPIHSLFSLFPRFPHFNSSHIMSWRRSFSKGRRIVMNRASQESFLNEHFRTEKSPNFVYHDPQSFSISLWVDPWLGVSSISSIRHSAHPSDCYLVCFSVMFLLWWDDIFCVGKSYFSSTSVLLCSTLSFCVREDVQYLIYIVHTQLTHTCIHTLSLYIPIYILLYIYHLLIYTISIYIHTIPFTSLARDTIYTFVYI